MTVLVTGAAGFIGSAVTAALLTAKESVIGLDDLNHYYDPSLKLQRLRRLESNAAFEFVHGDIAQVSSLMAGKTEPTTIIHLAAQAGVRYSVTHPRAYLESNLLGFGEVLEYARVLGVGHLVYASSSSVYGANVEVPFTVTGAVNHPVSLYAATKRANELMAEAYSHLYGLPMTGLRFFTVYGPWGRPDMAYFSFTDSILAKAPITVYGDGLLRRDFTYIDDIVDGVLRCWSKAPEPQERGTPDVNGSSAPHRIFNLGNTNPVTVLDLVHTLERELGQAATIQHVEQPAGDVQTTWADIAATQEWCGYKPTVPLAVGISRFVRWYRNYYGV